MAAVRRTISCMIIMLLCNGVFLWSTLSLAPALKIIFAVALALLLLLINLSPLSCKNLPRSLRTLARGCELLFCSAVCAVAQSLAYIYLWLGSGHGFSAPIWIGNIVLSVLVLVILLANALIRLFFSSAQMTLAHRLCLIFLWWLPVANFFVFDAVYRVARAERDFALLRLRRNREREGQNVCETKYPLLLVHGIFFRDWDLLGYWGRIPKELEENGAVIRYGSQQSSSSVESSAAELRERILGIVEETGCEKVNIIAHSKGGLDSRYAISCLGMDEYVASLTTINTPHRGCRFAKKALDNLPENLVSFVSARYDKIFSKLGDDKPDFFSGVSDLTDEKCAELNELLTDREGVLYRSVGSKMSGAKSAAFPLNLGYSIVKAVDGENDGLVALPSMPWGEFTLLEPKGKKGISHGDVIDLTRKDVPGFDVCEFYVEMVRSLKAQGL